MTWNLVVFWPTYIQVQQARRQLRVTVVLDTIVRWPGAGFSMECPLLVGSPVRTDCGFQSTTFDPQALSQTATVIVQWSSQFDFVMVLEPCFVSASLEGVMEQLLPDNESIKSLPKNPPRM